MIPPRVNRKGEVIPRRRNMNPAPHEKLFEPAWVDKNTNVQYCLADPEADIVSTMKDQQPGAIVFWARAPGLHDHVSNIESPAINENITLWSLSAKGVGGSGRVSHVFQSRKRTMMCVVVDPFQWENKK